jgi:phenylalanyl-tRNA synthetase beta chain
MPKIDVQLDDLQGLIGERIAGGRLDALLDQCKAEIDSLDEATGTASIELRDTNRPDLWSAEGIARQIRFLLGRGRIGYPFFDAAPAAQLLVDPDARRIRPYVAAFVCRGVKVTDPSLRALIQTQEKLTENYGRHRKSIAIGVYRVAKVRFPVHYRAVERDARSYVPLGMDEPMTLGEILEKHPKGQQYAWILEGLPLVPLLEDEAGTILSMPPIINSRALGEVQIGDSELFVEGTGLDQRTLAIAMNILAVDLADRGGRIERVETVYPYDTPMGRRVASPRHLGETVEFAAPVAGRMLGIRPDARQIAEDLARYGCDAQVTDNRLAVTCPPYRGDYLHAVDAIEDVAIVRGYGTFEPIMPTCFTVGELAESTRIEDKVRDLMIGFGYEELICNILCDPRDVLERMNRPADEKIVRIANPMLQHYSAVRDMVLPSLLITEAASSTALYPHRIFEAGQCARCEPAANYGSRTETHLAALLAAKQVTFSDIHSVLELLVYYMDHKYTLAEHEHPSFIGGRCGRILLDGEPAGVIGEIHPQVLANFQIQMPAVALELDLAAFRRVQSPTAPGSPAGPVHRA